MPENPLAGFGPLGQFESSPAMQSVRAIQQADAEQRRRIEEETDVIAEGRRAEAKRQEERDEHQRELVELQRRAAEREAQRDEEQAMRDQAEAKRKRNELIRWAFTALIAVAGLTVAIVGLAAR